MKGRRLRIAGRRNTDTHSVPGNGHEEIQERESILILLQRRKDSIINK